MKSRNPAAFYQVCLLSAVSRFGGLQKIVFSPDWECSEHREGFKHFVLFFTKLKKEKKLALKSKVSAEQSIVFPTPGLVRNTVNWCHNRHSNVSE